MQPVGASQVGELRRRDVVGACAVSGRRDAGVTHYVEWLASVGWVGESRATYDLPISRIHHGIRGERHVVQVLIVVGDGFVTVLAMLVVSVPGPVAQLSFESCNTAGRLVEVLDPATGQVGEILVQRE